MSDPQRDQFRAHWIKHVSAGECPHSGVGIASCKAGLCDCFDVRLDDPGNDDETLGKFFDEAFPPLPLHRTEAGYPNCSTCDTTKADNCFNGQCRCGPRPACVAGKSCVSGTCQ